MRSATLLAALLAVFAATPALAVDPETVQVVRNSADKLWGECVTAKARDLAHASREPADTLATAALGACQQWEGAVRDSTAQIVHVLPDADARTARVMSDRREHWREQAVLAVIEARRR